MPLYNNTMVAISDHDDDRSSEPKLLVRDAFGLVPLGEAKQAIALMPIHKNNISIQSHARLSPNESPSQKSPPTPLIHEVFQVLSAEEQVAIELKQPLYCQKRKNKPPKKLLESATIAAPFEIQRQHIVLGVLLIIFFSLLFGNNPF